MTDTTTKRGPAARVAVIGLGACGLVTLKNLLEAGFDAVGFERNDYMGGLWKFSPENKTTVLKTTIANLSKQGGCYTDFPFSDSVVGNYATADQFAQYFEEYAKAFGLLDRVKLGMPVEKISRSKSNDGWEISFRPRGKEQVETATFDKVALCHGLQVQEPKMPKIEGIDTFTGLAMHSNEYKGPEPFNGKTVVVVGMGNTGPDVACDLVGHASKVYLSHRRGHAILSRNRNGKPADHIISMRLTVFAGLFNKYFPNLSQRAALFGLKKIQDKTWEVKPEWNLHPFPLPTRGGPTMNEDLVPYLHAGKIGLLSGLKRVNGGTLELYDGSHVENIDAIIFCTGFRANYSIIDAAVNPCRDTRKDWPTLKGANGRPLPRLYQGLFSLDYPDSFAILGTSPFTPQACLNYDLCSMAVAQVWKGNSSLPSLEEMNKHVDAQHEVVCKIASTGDLFNTNFRNNWDWFKWADQAAGLGLVKRIGYGVEGWKFWWNDRALCRLVLDGLMSPHIMRLFDEGKRKPWDGAREELEKVNGVSKKG
ncbi:FAD/NAD(P)-binding domain-containing protein [Rhizodiscina lignyota]|uniref:FAD/NAD(P)-binding domain-containing protein n=1 Tax=Rhizodiscina lignyota TaxID=1504668 RepID=A0A9P4IP17_9PEZI|nr:FAD/NAD(P)-binding domain-containing protein [Rhizodiscina lignyota]